MATPRKPRTDDLVGPIPKRRWDFYTSDREKNQGDLADPVSSGEGSAGIFPNDPEWGSVWSVGDATHPAAVQLLNPVGSLVNLKVYELYLSFVAHATSATCFGKITSTPTTLASPRVWAPILLDGQSVRAIIAKMNGWTTSTAPTILTETTGEFPFGNQIEGAAGFQAVAIRMPDSFPIIIPPGSALEFTADTNSASTKIRMSAVVDEEAAT